MGAIDNVKEVAKLVKDLGNMELYRQMLTSKVKSWNSRRPIVNFKRGFESSRILFRRLGG